jgi:hypothetical protein
VTKFADSITREVTSGEGVTSRAGRFGTVEFRLGGHVLGRLPIGGLVDERTVIARLREAYDRAVAGLDRRAGVHA